MIKQFIRPYKIKAIVLMNTVELDLFSMVRIYSVVNINRIAIYKEQVEEQIPLRQLNKVCGILVKFMSSGKF